MPDTRDEEPHENHLESDGEGNENDDRRRRLRRRIRTNKREPAVYIGSIPRGTRVSEFKTEVRGHDVAPMRVMWRGAARHAFLFFEHDSDVEDALGKLSNLEISGKGVKVERSTEREFNKRNDGDYESRGEGGRGDGNMRDRNMDRGAPRGGRGGGRGGRMQGGGSPSNRRPRQGRRAPSVFIGGIPRGTRVSDLKAQVRGLGVEPLRVLWRGGAGHTFLFFVKEEEVDDALNKLSELEVNERKLRVERGGQRSESHGSGDDEDVHHEERSPRQRRPPRRQRNRSLQEDEHQDERLDRGDRPERRARRGPPQGERLPAIYIGAIPRGTRAGEFKTQVREHDLAPFRLILRLGTGHAYLLFQSEDEVQDALHKLENLEINGKKVRVDKSTQEDGKEVDHEVTVDQLPS